MADRRGALLQRQHKRHFVSTGSHGRDARSGERHVAASRAQSAADVFDAVNVLTSTAQRSSQLHVFAFLPKVLSACKRNRCLADASRRSKLPGAVDLVRHCAALDGAYTDALHVSQVAVAQQRLGMYVDLYWQRLLHEGLAVLEARQPANVLKRIQNAAR